MKILPIVSGVSQRGLAILLLLAGLNTASLAQEAITAQLGAATAGGKAHSSNFSRDCNGGTNGTNFWSCQSSQSSTNSNYSVQAPGPFTLRNFGMNKEWSSSSNSWHRGSDGQAYSSSWQNIGFEYSTPSTADPLSEFAQDPASAPNTSGEIQSEYFYHYSKDTSSHSPVAKGEIDPVQTEREFATNTFLTTEFIPKQDYYVCKYTVRHEETPVRDGNRDFSSNYYQTGSSFRFPNWIIEKAPGTNPVPRGYAAYLSYTISVFQMNYDGTEILQWPREINYRFKLTGVHGGGAGLLPGYVIPRMADNTCYYYDWSNIRVTIERDPGEPLFRAASANSQPTIDPLTGFDYSGKNFKISSFVPNLEAFRLYTARVARALANSYVQQKIPSIANYLAQANTWFYGLANDLVRTDDTTIPERCKGYASVIACLDANTAIPGSPDYANRIIPKPTPQPSPSPKPSPQP